MSVFYGSLVAAGHHQHSLFAEHTGEVVVKVAGIVERIADYNHRTAGVSFPQAATAAITIGAEEPASPPRRHTRIEESSSALSRAFLREGVRMRAHSCSRSIYFLSLVGFTGASISL